MWARPASALLAVNQRMGDLVGNGIGEMGIPIKHERLSIEAQLFPPAGHSPLSGGFSFQVEQNFREIGMNSALKIKCVGLFADPVFLLRR